MKALKESESDSDIEKILADVKLTTHWFLLRDAWSVVRKETALNSKEFVSQRLEEDKISISDGIDAFLNAILPTEVVKAALNCFAQEAQNVLTHLQIHFLTERLIGKHRSDLELNCFSIF